MTAASAGWRGVTMRVMLASLVLLGIAIRVPQLFHTLFEPHSFRQTQTAFVAQQYAIHGIDLLSTPLPVFGTGSNVPMELPLFQAIASLIVNLGVSADLASRALGLLSFQAAAVLLALLLLKWQGDAVAVLAVALFEFLPYGLFWGASSLIDFFAVALAMLMLFALRNWFFGGGRRWVLIGTGAALGAFLVKVTTAPLWCLLLLAFAIIAIGERGWRASWRRVLIGFLAAPAVGLLAAIAWTAFADSIKRASASTSFLTSSNLRDWNFGTAAQRVDPSVYWQAVHRISSEMAGPLLFTLVLGLSAALFNRAFPRKVETLGWIVTALAGPLIFLNLYTVHSYYLIAIYPAVVAVMAVGIVWAVRLLPARRDIRWMRIATIVVILTVMSVAVGTSTLGRADISGWAASPPPSGAAIAIRDNTAPGAMIVMIGCDWDPTYLYYAEREGLMIRGDEAAAVWTSQNIADYENLFSCSPGLDADAYLSNGYRAAPTSVSGLYVIHRS